MAQSYYQTKLEESGLLTKTQLTHEDYMNELLAFQDLLASIVINDGESHRTEEIIVELNNKARAKQVEKDPQVRKGIAALRQINKEISISIAGKHGEDRVARVLEFITRPSCKYRNIYITDGERETELDNLILTENGLIILEVKNVKTDITINENGRILYDNQCFHDISLCEKMQLKRELLKAEIEKRMAEKGLSIPVTIDSYIVFSTQRGVRIKVNDLCKKEKHCFKGSLPFIIDAYRSNEYLTDEEMASLDSIINEMETQKKCFDVKLDFNQIRSDIGGALDTCMDHPIMDTATEEQETPKKEEDSPIVNLKEYRRNRAKRFSAAALAATAVLSAGAIFALRARR